MRWLADENLPETVLAALRGTGEDVTTVADMALSTDDAMVVRLAQPAASRSLT